MWILLKCLNIDTLPELTLAKDCPWFSGLTVTTPEAISMSAAVSQENRCRDGMSLAHPEVEK